jgi:hypothetical protein
MKLTVAQIDALLLKLNDVARETDPWQLGLPVHLQAGMLELRAAVVLWAEALTAGGPAASTTHVHRWTEGERGLAQCSCGQPARSWYCPSNPTHLCSFSVADPDICEFCAEPGDRP